jgi:hypothetical protein
MFSVLRLLVKILAALKRIEQGQERTMAILQDMQTAVAAVASGVTAIQTAVANMPDSIHAADAAPLVASLNASAGTLTSLATQLTPPVA